MCVETFKLRREPKGAVECDEETEQKLSHLEMEGAKKLAFLGDASHRLYKKTTQNQTAELALRKVLHEYGLDIDYEWAVCTKCNTYPHSDVIWTNNSYQSYEVDDRDRVEGVLVWDGVVSSWYNRNMKVDAEESRVVYTLAPTEMDIASAVISEHLHPAAKALQVREMFMAIYEYLGGQELEGWSDVDMNLVHSMGSLPGNATVLDMLFFVVRVFGRAVMILSQPNASRLFKIVGANMRERIKCFNVQVVKRCLRTNGGKFVHHVLCDCCFWGM